MTPFRAPSHARRRPGGASKAWAFDPDRMPRLNRLDPRMGDLAQNAAWRALLAWSRRQWAKRVLMSVVFQTVMLLLFTSELSALGGGDFGLGCCLTATLAVGMFALYHLIGVPGYEACLELSRRHDDWASSRVTARDLALAVWGRLWLGSGAVSFLIVGGAAVGLAAVLSRYPLDFGFLAVLAALAGGMVIGMAPFSGFVSLPMTLFWSSGMVHGGRGRLSRMGFHPPAAGQGFRAGGFAWTARFLLGGVAFTCLVVVPACLWLWAFTGGISSPTTLNALKLHFRKIVTGIGLGGLVLGAAWGGWTRRAGPALLDRLTDRLGLVMELRRILRHEGKPRS